MRPSGLSIGSDRFRAVSAAHDLRWPDLVWSHFSRPRFGGFDERVSAAAAAGFAGIALFAPEYARLRDEEGRSAKDIGRQLDDHGLVLAEIETVHGWASTGEAAAESARRETLAYELADELGCRHLQAIVEAADRSNGGYCVDIWHHTRGAADDAMIRALPGDRVVAVQMDDGPRQPQLADYKQDCMLHRVPPGEGEFDCVGFVRMLTEIGVQAPISLEICSAELWAAPAEEAARRAADAMRAVLVEAG